MYNVMAHFYRKNTKIAQLIKTLIRKSENGL